MYTFVIPLRSSIRFMFVNMPHIKYTRTFNFVDNNNNNIQHLYSAL